MKIGLYFVHTVTQLCSGTAMSAHDAPVLTQRRLSELVKEVDPTQLLDEDVEEVSKSAFTALHFHSLTLPRYSC